MDLVHDFGDACRVVVCQKRETSGSARGISHDGTSVNLAKLAHIRFEALYEKRQR